MKNCTAVVFGEKMLNADVGSGRRYMFHATRPRCRSNFFLHGGGSTGGLTCGVADVLG